MGGKERENMGRGNNMTFGTSYILFMLFAIFYVPMI